MPKPKKIVPQKGISELEKSDKSSNKDEEEEKASDNPKKKTVVKNHRKSIFINTYMKEIIKEVNKKGKENLYCCQICPGKPEFVRRSVLRHITESETHENFASQDNHKSKHEDLKQRILKDKENNTRRKQRDSVDPYIQDYLEFLAFCLKQNLSFLQISSLGKYLNNMANFNRLDFFGKYGFDDEEISKVSNIFGKSLIEEITQDLSNGPFSVTIDNVTVSGKSICGLQVKYLKKYLDEEGLQRSSIENRIIGLKYLEESSSAEVLYETVQEKLLALDPEIRNNFRGLAHDHASNLSGTHKGLGALLEKDLPNYFMDLEDPCHSINLTLNKSLDDLPEEITKFIKKIHSHFSWPQRVAYLLKLQKEMNLNMLSPIHFKETRWLSMGMSLKRLTKIWESVTEYMKRKPQAIVNKKKVNYDYFIKLLEDKLFYFKIIALTGIIDKLNAMNIKFQNQKMEIQNFKKEILRTLQDFINLLIIPSAVPSDITRLDRKEWVDIEDQKKHFLPMKDFLSKLVLEVDPHLEAVLEFSEAKKKKFTELFQKFLWNIISYLVLYLPYSNSITTCLDFVTLNDSPLLLKEKILTFDEIFGITNKTEKIELCEEINDLISSNINWMQIKAQNSSLYLWDLFNGVNEKNDNGEIKYKHLKKIFNIVHSLPTSSACIEQSFSTLKFIKNLLRNSLREETVQSLLVIAQEFRNKEISITETMLNRYCDVKEALKIRKSGSNLKEISFNQPTEEVSPEILILQEKDVNFEEHLKQDAPDNNNKRIEYWGKYSKDEDCLLGGVPPILKGQKMNYSDKIIPSNFL